MLRIQSINAEEYVRQPWKNGRGETLEIAIHPTLPYLWRVSTARVTESGSFSIYPGYRRTIVTLDGPIRLEHAGKKGRELPRMSAYSFKGDWETGAEVSSPVQDFNVFALADFTRAGVFPTQISADEAMQFPVSGQEHFIFTVSGQLDVLDPNSQQTFTLFPQNTLRVSRSDNAEYLNLKSKAGANGAAFIWVVIHT